jgi:hypothetical protein
VAAAEPEAEDVPATERGGVMAKAKTLTIEQKRSIFCVKHGHSKLRDHFFGYHYCCRCGQQLGDSLGSVYSDDSAVYVHHMHVATKGETMRGCDCPERAKKLKKIDFMLVPQWNGFGFEQRPPWRQKVEGESPSPSPAGEEGR